MTIGLACVPMLLGALELAGCNCHSNTNLDEGSSSSSSTGAETSSSAGATTTVGTTESSSSSAGEEVGGTTAASGGNNDQCHGTADCDAAMFCVAPYADNDRGDFACVGECLGPMDEDSWCYDAAACCDPTAVCTIRGYCESASADSSTSSTTDGESTSSSTG